MAADVVQRMYLDGDFAGHLKRHNIRSTPLEHVLTRDEVTFLRCDKTELIAVYWRGIFRLTD